MRNFKLFAVLAAMFLLAPVYAQDNIGSHRSPNEPHPMERGKEGYHERDAFYPPGMEDELKEALESGNHLEAERLKQEMDRATPDEYKYESKFNQTDDKPAAGSVPPFTNDWYGNDVMLYPGEIKYGDPYFRQLDMKMGEDGNMYVALNRSPVTGTNGRIDVYRSSNGGATWTFTNAVQTTTAYYGTVSLLVEVRDGSGNPDSARVFVFYTRSAGSNNDNATINYASWRRDGSAWYSAEIASPGAGNEFSFASAVSDGAFYTTATYVGVVCTESNNALTMTQNVRYFRSVNWGSTWTGVTISTGWNDFYPSADLRPGSGSGSDSVWIAVERRFGAGDNGIRVIRTPFAPTASNNTYFITTDVALYEKPALTVKQNRSCDSAIITTTKNGVSYYCPTVNGGGAWDVDFTLGGTANGSNKAFTWCASSPNGSGHFIAVWISNDGDSMNVRRGVINFLGTTLYKRNSTTASTSVSPTSIIYTPDASTNYSAFSYAGFGPTNIYTNQEALVTGIASNGTGIPDAYSLSQNYPNPFNPSTNINFSIPKQGMVRLMVYDMLGKQVATLVNENLNAGTYNVDFNAAGFTSGVYFYRIDSDGFSDIKKMMLIK